MHTLERDVHTRHARSESRVTRTTKEKAWSDVRILRRQEAGGVCFHGSRVRKQGKALFKFEKKNRGTSRAVSNGHSCVAIGRRSHVRITLFSDNDAKGSMRRAQSVSILVGGRMLSARLPATKRQAKFG